VASPAFSHPWGSGRWFVVTFAIVAAVLLLLGREFYFFTPLYETGDLAANSLQIDRAIHLAEILGNYSRFQFHHPGPAFFYVYGAGQVVFSDILHIVPGPHNGQLLAGALLQAAFLSLGITVAGRFVGVNRGVFVAAAISLALIHFHLSGNLEFSLWPPDQLVVPFLAFVMVAAGLSCGWIELLPVLVLCGGFLVHGHVAQPLFVGPLGAASVALGCWRSYRAGAAPLRSFLRTNMRWFAAALTLLAVFVAPLVLDAARGPGSNLSAIVAYLGVPAAPSDAHPASHFATYLLSFLAYPAERATLDFSPGQLASYFGGHPAGLAASVLVLVIWPVGLWFSRKRGRVDSAARPAPDAEPASASSPRLELRGLIASGYLFVALTAALALIWVALQRGPLYEFNSFFIYGLMYAAALLPLAAAANRLTVSAGRVAATIAAAVAVVLVATTALPMPMAEDPNGLRIYDDVRAVVARKSSQSPVLLEFRPVDWPDALAVALSLDRCHVQWYVEPAESFLFGPDHVFVSGATSSAGTGGNAAVTPEKWWLVPPNSTHVGQVPLGATLAIYPPPSLSR